MLPFLLSVTVPVVLPADAAVELVASVESNREYFPGPNEDAFFSDLNASNCAVQLPSETSPVISSLFTRCNVSESGARFLLLIDPVKLPDRSKAFENE